MKTSIDQWIQESVSFNKLGDGAKGVVWPHDQVVKVRGGDIWSQCFLSISGLLNDQISCWIPAT